MAALRWLEAADLKPARILRRRQTIIVALLERLFPLATKTIIVFSSCAGLLTGLALSRLTALKEPSVALHGAVEVAIPPMPVEEAPRPALRPAAPTRENTEFAKGEAPGRQLVAVSGLQPQSNVSSTSGPEIALPDSSESALRLAMTSGDPQDWASPAGRRGLVVVSTTYAFESKRCRDFSVFVSGEPVESGVRCGDASLPSQPKSGRGIDIIFIQPPASSPKRSQLAASENSSPR